MADYYYYYPVTAETDWAWTVTINNNPYAQPPRVLRNTAPKPPPPPPEPEEYVDFRETAR